jgi:hypothetical protein
MAARPGGPGLRDARHRRRPTDRRLLRADVASRRFLRGSGSRAASGRRDPAPIQRGRPTGEDGRRAGVPAQSGRRARSAGPDGGGCRGRRRPPRSTTHNVSAAPAAAEPVRTRVHRRRLESEGRPDRSATRQTRHHRGDAPADRVIASHPERPSWRGTADCRLGVTRGTALGGITCALSGSGPAVVGLGRRAGVLDSPSRRQRIASIRCIAVRAARRTSALFCVGSVPACVRVLWARSAAREMAARITSETARDPDTTSARRDSVASWSGSIPCP